MIETHRIYTGMGRSRDFTEILGKEHGEALDEIGYTGSLKGVRMSYQDYLDSIATDEVEYDITALRVDNAEFTATYMLTVVTRKAK